MLLLNYFFLGGGHALARFGRTNNGIWTVKNITPAIAELTDVDRVKQVWSNEVWSIAAQ